MSSKYTIVDLFTISLTAIKSIEKGVADKEIVNKSTIVYLEDICNTLEDRMKDMNASTKSAIEENAEKCKGLKAELDASEGLVSQFEIELEATKKTIYILFDKVSDVRSI